MIQRVTSYLLNIPGFDFPGSLRRCTISRVTSKNAWIAKQGSLVHATVITFIELYTHISYTVCITM